jgi:hypothetical protein
VNNPDLTDRFTEQGLKAESEKKTHATPVVPGPMLLREISKALIGSVVCCDFCGIL